MDSFNGSLKVALTYAETLNAIGTTPLRFAGDTTDLYSALQVGVSVGQVNAFYFDQRVLKPLQHEILDLRNIPAGPSNYWSGFAFSLVKVIVIRLVDNGDNPATFASSIRIGDASFGPGTGTGTGTGSGGHFTDEWSGWLSHGATEDVDFGGTPYNKCSDVGRVVDHYHRSLKIANLDPGYKATYQIIMFGLK